MILQTLYELYDRLAQDDAYGIAPPGFSPQKVSFKIVLRPDGTLHDIIDARRKRTLPAKGKNPPKVIFEPSLMLVPAHKKRTSSAFPQFMCDKSEYILGIGKSGLAKDKFELFRDFHIGLESEINSKWYSAVCLFLKSWQPASFSEKYAINDPHFDNFGVFQIISERKEVHEDEQVRKWWLSHYNEPDSSAKFGQCLITGEENTELCSIHPDIKGFASSTSLVNIQSNTPFESYAKSSTENCPVSKHAAFRYGTALNALTIGPQKRNHCFTLAGTKVAYWTKEKTVLESCFADIFGDLPNDTESQDATRLESIKSLLHAIKTGGALELDSTSADVPFYILGLEQPNPGRISVRFFHRSTVAELLEKLHQHQSHIAIVREFDGSSGKRRPDPEFPPLWMFLSQTVRRGDDVPPLLGGALVRSIITGGKYPEGLYTAILRRIHADRTINYLRAAMIKAVLVRNHSLPIPIMLDTENTDPAYLLGRLFAALEKTQEEALPGLNATIRDRYYSSASATPRSVFPRLLRTYQHHLEKMPHELAKNNKSIDFDLALKLKRKREILVQDIFGFFSADGYPPQLSLLDQGKFAIGYYHQRKAFFPAKAKDPETLEPVTA